MRPATWSTRSPKPRSKAAGSRGGASRSWGDQPAATAIVSSPHGHGPEATKPPLPTMRQMTTRYFFLPEAKVGCHAEAFWRRGGNHLDLLFFRFLGLPISSLLAVSHVDLLGLRMTQELDLNRANVVSQVSSGPKRRCAFRSYS